MSPKKTTNSNGSITLSKLFEYVEGNNATIDLKLNEIKFEVQKNRTEVLERLITMTSEIKERLVKIESQPAHENFQRQFCPNTKEIEELKEIGTKGLRDYVFQHQAEHKLIGEKLDKVLDEIEQYKKLSELKQQALVSMYEKKMDERDERARRAMWAGFIAIAAIAVPALIELSITIFG